MTDGARARPSFLFLLAAFPMSIAACGSCDSRDSSEQPRRVVVAPSAVARPNLLKPRGEPVDAAAD